MDKDLIPIIIICVVFGLFFVIMCFLLIKTFFKDYVSKLRAKKSHRTQPLTAATLNVGDALLIKEKVRLSLADETRIAKVYYEVKERRPASIVFVRKDNLQRELSYQQVDMFISNGVIADFI